MSDTDIPKIGDPLTTKQFEMILEAIAKRQQNFPEEPGAMSMAIVMFNIGDRFTPVYCVNGEWEGIKTEAIPTDGPPTCPDGHVLMQGTGMTLGWVTNQ